MSVDSRLDDLETFQRNAQRRLKALEDGQSAILARLDQIVAGQQEILSTINPLATTVAGLQQGCVNLQAALNEYRVRVRQTFRGEGQGV